MKINSGVEKFPESIAKLFFVVSAYNDYVNGRGPLLMRRLC
jgi:hypothetical protein